MGSVRDLGTTLVAILALAIFNRQILYAQNSANPQDPASQGESIEASDSNFQTDLFSGTFRYSVPIKGAPARGGFDPQLSLSYNSSSGNGWVGVGWSLSPGYIQRNTTNGVPIKWNESGGDCENRYDDAKGFVFSFNGSYSELVATGETGQLGGALFRPKLEGSYLKFELLSDKWVVSDLKGHIHIFGEIQRNGQMINSRFTTAPARDRIFRWAITESQDANGNLIRYNYSFDGNQQYLSQIDYNGHVLLGLPSFTHRIRFELGERDPVGSQPGDESVSYAFGYRVETNKILSRIISEVGPTPFRTVRSYDLSYRQSPTTLRFTLASVIERGNNDSNPGGPSEEGIRLIFGYQQGPDFRYPVTGGEAEVQHIFGPTQDFRGLDNQGNPGLMQYPHYLQGDTSVLVDLYDVNRDGYADRVMRSLATPNSYDKIAVQLNSKHGSFEPLRHYSFRTIESGIVNRDRYINPGVTEIGRNQLQAIDLNRDGFIDRVYNADLNWPDLCFTCPPGVNAPENFAVDFGRAYYGGSGVGFDLSRAAFGPLTQVPWVANLWAPQNVNIYSGETEASLIDMNGDGLPERVVKARTDVQPSYYAVFRNTGSGFSNVPYKWTQSWPFPSPPSAVTHVAGDQYLSTINEATIDLNGDGLPDKVLADAYLQGRGLPGDTTNLNFDKLWVMYNNGSGFDPPEAWGGQVTDSVHYTSLLFDGSICYWGGSTLCQLSDINGDGLLDRIVNGTGSGSGDVASQWMVQINIGKGFTYGIRIDNIDSWGESNIGRACNPDDSDCATSAMLADINGDSLVDRVGVGVDQNSYRVQLNTIVQPDLLSYISTFNLDGDIISGQTTIAYRNAREFDNTLNNVSQLSQNHYVVSEVSQSDGPVGATAYGVPYGNVYTTTYSYGGGLYDYAEREFRGFHRVEVTRPDGSREVNYFHQGGGREGDQNFEGEFEDLGSIAKKGHVFKQETYGENGNLYREIFNQIVEDQVSPGRYLAATRRKVVIEYVGDGDPSHKRTTAQDLYYEPGTGNLLLTHSYGEITSFNRRSYDVSGNVNANDDLYFKSTFASINTPNGGKIRYLPLTEIISTDLAQNNKVAKKEFQYSADNRGNVVLRRQHELRSNATYDTTLQYDNYGNAISSVDPAGLETRIDFDPVYRQFPLTTTVDPGGLNLISRKTFDPRSAKVLRFTEVRDPNSSADDLVTISRYDDLYRVTEIALQLPGGAEIWKKRYTYSLNGYSSGTFSSPTSFNYVKENINDGIDPINGLVTYNYFDGLGRHLQTRAEAENGQYRVSNSEYDLRGNHTKSTRVTFSAGYLHTLIPSGAVATTRQFDAISRLTVTSPPPGDAPSDSGSSPTGSTTVEYSINGSDPWGRTITNARQKSKKYYEDAFGRVIRIDEFPDGTESRWDLSYDNLGNLTSLQKNAQPETLTRMEYDTLGRKVHTNHPDSGSWNYEYDPVGKLLRQVDGMGHVIRNRYDILGRIVEKAAYVDTNAEAADNAESRDSYEYDLSDDPAYTVYPGLLYRVTDSQGFEKLSYDIRGRIVKRTRYLNITPNKSYTIGYEYDDGDNITRIIYPDGTSARYHRDNAGFLDNLTLHRTSTDVNPDQVFATPFDIISRDPMGRATQAHFGNGLTARKTYYPLSQRLWRMETIDQNSQPLQDLGYTYDKVGNVTNIIDLLRSGNTSGELLGITYDGIDRLKSYRRGGVTKTFGYDALGNIRTNPETGATYSYDAVQPHAVDSANGVNYLYDQNGNMIRRGSQILRYDSRNRLREVEEGGERETFGYDASGVRLWRRATLGSSNYLSLWIGGLYEIKEEIGDLMARKLNHVLADSQRVCTFSAVGGGRVRRLNSPIEYSIDYFHGDHLSSTNIITDENGALRQRLQYTPYGDELYVQNVSGVLPTNRYTDQPYDRDTGLYFYGARYYDAKLGRFIQPDQLMVTDLMNPQSFNPYTYVLNNPLKMSDPSGNSPDEVEEEPSDDFDDDDMEEETEDEPDDPPDPAEIEFDPEIFDRGWEDFDTFDVSAQDPIEDARDGIFDEGISDFDNSGFADELDKHDPDENDNTSDFLDESDFFVGDNSSGDSRGSRGFDDWDDEQKLGSNFFQLAQDDRWYHDTYLELSDLGRDDVVNFTFGQRHDLDWSAGGIKFGRMTPYSAGGRPLDLRFSHIHSKDNLEHLMMGVGLGVQATENLYLSVDWGAGHGEGNFVQFNLSLKNTQHGSFGGTRW